MTRWICLFLLLFASVSVALPTKPGRELPSGDGPWVIQAHFSNPDQLVAMGWEFDVWQVDRKAGYASVMVMDRTEFSRLLGLGVTLAVDPQRSTELTTWPMGDSKAGIMGYPCYRTVTESYATLEDIVRDYPELAERIVIGESWAHSVGAGGHPLEVLKLTRRATGPKPPLFVTAAVHAREYATAELVTRFAEFLVEQYTDNATAGWLLDHREIHLLLMTNPDGRERAQTGVKWRKNLNEAHCTGFSPGQGVDLNRNFSFGWGQFEGSSDMECESTFRGVAPESEPETRAVAEYMTALFGDHRPADLVTPADDSVSGMYLDVHSFGRLVLWPWGYEEVPVPNGRSLETLARRMAWFNSYRPQQELLLYPIDGSTGQFAYGELGVAALTLELGDSFFEGCPLFDAIVASNMPALVYAAQVADAPYQTPAGPSVSELLVLPGTIIPGETTTLQITGTDGQVSLLGGTSPIHAIAGFDVQIESTANGGVVLTEQSVSSGSSTRMTLDSSGLSLGRYRVNVRAADDSGALGPWYSALLDVVDPQQTGVLTGSIRSKTDNRPLPGLLTVDHGQGASDPLSGGIRLRLPPGTYTPRFESPGYVEASLPETVLDATTVRPLTTRLQPLCEVFSEDAEDGLAGWTGDWGVTSESAAGGSFSLTDSPGGPYSPGVNVAASPEFDLSQAASAELVFSYRCDTEPQFDFGRVQIRQGGGVPRTIFECTGDTGDWQSHSADLATFLGRSGLKLNVHLSADEATEDDGFYLDDIRVLAELPDGCPGQAETDFVFSGDLSGTWFDPTSSGQGFVVEVSEISGQPVLVVTMYTYEEGEALWLIGSTPIEFDQGSATLTMFRAAGTGFGDAFDPGEVELESWGEVTLAFSDAGNARADYRRNDDASGSFQLIRLTTGLTDQAAPGLSGIMSGAWYEPDRPGQGMTVELSDHPNGPVALVTWYTYLDGRPVWLFGSAPFVSGDHTATVEMSSFSGTGFGAQFDPAAIVSETWGPLELSFDSCQAMRVNFDFDQGSGELVLSRLTGGLLSLICNLE